MNVTFPAQAEPSSPFYDLQNQSDDKQQTTPDTGADDGVPTQQESGEKAGDTAVEEQPADTGQNAGDDSSEAEEVEQAEPDEQPESDEQPSADETETGSDGSEADEDQSGEETRQTPSDQTASEPREDPEPETGRQQNETILPLRDPPLSTLVDTGLKSASWPDTLSSAPRGGAELKLSDTRPLTGIAESASPWYGNLYLMGGAVFLGGFGLIGLLYLGRRRKVRIIKTANRTANKYLNMNRTDSGVSSRSSSGRPSGTISSGTPSTESASVDSTSSAPEQVAEPTWDRSDEELKQLGIDPRYRSIFKMHYQDGLSAEQIAEQTDFGEGEVGLALDLVDRVDSNSG